MRPALDAGSAAARALQAPRKVRLTFPEALARQLGVATPPLPSVEERKKRALQYAEVRLSLAAARGLQMHCMYRRMLHDT